GPVAGERFRPPGDAALTAEAVAQQVGRDAAQPAGETALLRVEVAHAAHGGQPGFLHDLVGQVVQPGAAPVDVRPQSGGGGVVPLAPGPLVPGEDGGAEAEFVSHAVAV